MPQAGEIIKRTRDHVFQRKKICVSIYTKILIMAMNKGKNALLNDSVAAQSALLIPSGFLVKKNSSCQFQRHFAKTNFTSSDGNRDIYRNISTQQCRLTDYRDNNHTQPQAPIIRNCTINVSKSNNQGQKINISYIIDIIDPISLYSQ